MNKAIGFVMVGTNDLEKSSKFYDAILVHLKMKRVTVTERYIGYGYSEDQYRSELRGMLSRSVGALGLTDAAQIEDFMTQFLEDERNKARLRTRMMRKYGPPKTDTVAGAGSVTTGSNARNKKVSEAIVVNPRLQED